MPCQTVASSNSIPFTWRQIVIVLPRSPFNCTPPVHLVYVSPISITRVIHSTSIWQTPKSNIRPTPDLFETQKNVTAPHDIAHHLNEYQVRVTGMICHLSLSLFTQWPCKCWWIHWIVCKWIDHSVSFPFHFQPLNFYYKCFYRM